MADLIQELDKAELLRMYHEMVLVRRLEERSAALYQEGKIGGFLHLYIGQEAVGTGVLSVRTPEDRVITAYRDHGTAISCGLSARAIMAELLGKATGASKGKGGSMHLADVERNFWGGHAIVGAHLPIAAGLAADKYAAGPSRFANGDGATNIGYFHEALNLSMVWRLPVLWICENNMYGMGTAVDRASAVPQIRQKAEGYGMPNERVEGMDVLTVRAASEKALAAVRSNGPFLLEIVTYRFRGHSMGDPERYRSPAEVQKWQENDPIGIYRRRLIDAGRLTAKDLDAEEAEVDSEIEDAVRFAEASPDPAPEELFRDIYVEPVS
jgi:pyruvate dehydrogenase E1 component alpha subunit